MDFTREKVVSAERARKLLGASDSEWRQLIAEGLLDLAVSRSGRGMELRTDVQSLERAKARLDTLR